MNERCQTCGVVLIGNRCRNSRCEHFNLRLEESKPAEPALYKCPYCGLSGKREDMITHICKRKPKPAEPSDLADEILRISESIAGITTRASKPAAPSHGTEAHIAIHTAEPTADERPALREWTLEPYAETRRGDYVWLKIIDGPEPMPGETIHVREVKKHD